MTAYTPNHKNRPPCHGCKYCTEYRDAYTIGYWCTARTKTGRCIYKISNYILASNRELMINDLKRRIRENVRPKWCPEEKGAHNNGNMDS